MDYERFNQEVPEELIEPPLHDIEYAIWDAFWELSTDRQIGMGSGPIPYSSIARFEQENPGLDLGGYFRSIIRDMDIMYLTHKDGESTPFTRDKFKQGG